MQLETNLYDPKTYLNGIPHEALTKLRNECPVYFHEREEPGGRGFWLITRYEDIVYISKNPGLFSSARGGTNIPDYEEEDLSQIQLLMVNMDPPQHRKFRNLVRRGFTPRRVRVMTDKIRTTVTNILDSVEGEVRIDFVRRIAAELPLIVIADLIGIPQEDRGKVFNWSNRLIGFDDPEFQTSIEDAREAAFEVWMYANSLAENRTGTADDLVHVLMEGEVDGEKLTEMEFDSFFLLLAVAGNETTRNAISGGLLALLEHPDELARLKADAGLLTTAVEEVLRWVTPLNYFRRTATQDIELRGQLIKENDKIAMFYGSANRDESIFDDPFKFDVGRTPNDHLAFGVGEHFCLGASLARLEIHMLFEQLFERYPNIRLDGEVRRLQSNFINGIKEMQVLLQ